MKVDVETGAVEFLKYAAVHNAGTLVTTRSVGGQIIGGTAQGIATALLEEFFYDEEAPMVNANHQSYLIRAPRKCPS